MIVATSLLNKLFVKNPTLVGPLAGELSAVDLYLYVAALNPTVNTVYADMNQPTYAGYAPVAVVWNAVAQIAPGIWEVTSLPFNVSIANTDPSTTIAGFGIALPGGGPDLYLAEDFPSTYTLINDTQVLTFVVKMIVGDPTNPGSCVIIQTP